MTIPDPIPETIPEPVAERERGISLIWLVPLVAALIGGWIAWKTWTDRGPMITISFRNAEGIEAGKTRIRYKSLEVGRVEHLGLSDDLGQVVVKAQMIAGSERLLNADTRFWVVRPRISLGEVSGLSTLVSGSYIGLEPGSNDNERSRLFVGLEEPPVVASDAAGTFFHLRAETLGSLDRKSPLYYRRIRVGEVVDHRMHDNGAQIDIRVFVYAPYNDLVHENTRFWHASGIEANLSANGVEFHTESVESLLSGGIAFGLPEHEEPAAKAQEGAEFGLFRNLAEARERQFINRRSFLLHFQSSVRGLSEGAPVEFQGIKVGSVQSVELEAAPAGAGFRISVVIDVEPERFGGGQEELSGDESNARIKTLVEQGLRAQLKSGSLITGQLYVSLEMRQDAKPEALDLSGRYPAIPTIPNSIEEITQRLTGLLARIEQLPLESITANLDGTLAAARTTLESPQVLGTVSDLRLAIKELRGLLATSREAIGGVGGGLQQTLATLDTTLEKAGVTLDKAGGTIGAESQLHYQMLTTLEEITNSARSVKLMAEYLQNNPDAVLRGKR